MGPLPIILGVVGAVASAAGSFASASAQASAANYQAAVARNNAIIANYGAVNAANAARQQAQSQSLTNAARLAGIKSTIAASGIDVNSGSAEDVQTSQREIGQLSTENVQQKGELQAYGYQVQSYSDTAQAGLYQSEASAAPISGVLGATGSLLGNAKSFYSGGGGSAGGGGGNSVLSPDLSGLSDADFVG